MRLVKITKQSLCAVIVVATIAAPIPHAQAQFAAGAGVNASVYGYGMVPGMDMCGRPQYGPEAASVIDDMKENSEQLAERRKELLELKKALRTATTERNKAKRVIESYFVDGAAAELIEHMNVKGICQEVPRAASLMLNNRIESLYAYLFGEEEETADQVPQEVRPSRYPAQAADGDAGEAEARGYAAAVRASGTDSSSSSGLDSPPIEVSSPPGCYTSYTGSFPPACATTSGSGGTSETSSQGPIQSPMFGSPACKNNGELETSYVCNLTSAKKVRTAQPSTCVGALKKYLEQNNIVNAKNNEIEDKNKEIDAYKEALKDGRTSMRDAVKLDRETEAMCPDGSCAGKASSKDDEGFPWRELMGIGLAAGFGYLGYRGFMHSVDAAKQLGYTVPPHAALGYAAPFAMAGMYGAMAGSFGCAGTLGGVSPLLFGGLPAALYGGLGMGGGMYMPGMGFMGMPYMGMAMGGVLGGVMGMMSPMFGMPAMMPGMMMGGVLGGAMGGMMGMPMGGMMGMPMGMMMGGMMGGVLGGMMGMPMGGMGMMMGGMMPMYGMPGMMGLAGGGMMGIPMSGMMGLAGGGMMGLAGGGMMGMQYQQQMMQMQMQQMNMMMQQQQQAAANYQMRMQTVMSLQMEMQSLGVRLQQAMTGMGGFGYGLGGGIGGGINLGVGIGGGMNYYNGGAGNLIPPPPQYNGFPTSGGGPSGYGNPR